MVQKRTLYFVPVALKPGTLVKSAVGMFSESQSKGESFNSKARVVAPPVPGRKKKRVSFKESPIDDSLTGEGGGVVAESSLHHDETAEAAGEEEHPNGMHNQQEEENRVHTEL